MEKMIDILHENPEAVFIVIMAIWGFVEAMGWGFLTDEQRSAAKRIVRRLFGKL